MTFQRESWEDVGAEIAKLAPEHWRELAVDQQTIPLSLDVDRYTAFEKSGVLFVFTARNGFDLAGYYIAFLGPHPHYKDSGVMAITDVYYVKPEFRRGTGALLFMQAEKALKGIGVTKAYLSCKIHQNHSALFEALGWKATDLMFTKVLR